MRGLAQLAFDASPQIEESRNMFGSLTTGGGRWGVCAWLAVGSALAQPTQSDKAAADALFDAARSLMEQGNFREACPKLADSQRLDPGIGTLLNLGRCYVGNGQTASAWTTYREAAARARAEGQSEREALARQEASRLEPKLTRVVIHVSEAAVQAGVTVIRDGQELPKGLWGVPLPVDPGEHTLEASAPGKVSQSAKFNAVGEGVTIPVRVPPLTDAEAPVATPVRAAAPAPAAPPPPAAPASGPAPTSPGVAAADTGAAANTQRVLGYVAGGLGVAGLAVGGAFMLVGNGHNNDAKQICKGMEDACPPDQLDEWESKTDAAKRNFSISYVAYGVGGALLVTSAVLLLTADSDAATASGLRVVGGVTPQAGVLGLEGRF